MRRALLALLALALLAPGAVLVGLTVPTAAAPTDAWQPRAAQFPAVHVTEDVAVEMSDGVVLSVNVYRPARTDGTPVRGRFPVVVLTQTPYNKSTGAFRNDYLVQRGYVQVEADVRGTGSFGGTWASFDDREQRDSFELVRWAHSRKRPWSNGDVGLWGSPTRPSTSSSPPPSGHPVWRRCSRSCPPAASTATWSPPADRSTQDALRAAAGQRCAHTVADRPLDPPGGGDRTRAPRPPRLPRRPGGAVVRPVPGRASRPGDGPRHPAVTYDEIGSGRWRTAPRWIAPGTTGRTFHLDGTASPGAPGRLTRRAPESSGTDPVLPVPVAGLCSRSASQWTAGIASGSPCETDNRLDDATGTSYETAPFARPMRVQGPLNARGRRGDHAAPLPRAPEPPGGAGPAVTVQERGRPKATVRSWGAAPLAYRAIPPRGVTRRL